MFELFVFAVIGVFAGLSAGLLGLGGGLVTVPALLVVFSVMDMYSTHAMHIAVTTSLMAIISLLHSHLCLRIIKDKMLIGI